MLESIYKLVTFNVCKYCLIVTVHLFHHFIYCLLLFIFYIPLLVRNKKIFSIQFNTFTQPSQRLTQKTIPVTKQSTPNPNLSKCPYLKKRGSKRAVKISLAWVVNGPLRGWKEKVTKIIQSLPPGFHCSTFRSYGSHSTIKNSMNTHMETQRKCLRRQKVLEDC